MAEVISVDAEVVIEGATIDFNSDELIVLRNIMDRVQLGNSTWMQQASGTILDALDKILPNFDEDSDNYIKTYALNDPGMDEGSIYWNSTEGEWYG